MVKNKAMKKLFGLLAFVMPFLATSCVESLVEPETPADGTVTITLHTSQDTKTTLVDDKYVRWEEGDIVVINDVEYPVRLDENDPTKAYVDNVTAAETYLAWFSTVYQERQPEGLALLLSEEIPYREGGFSRYGNPMVAKGTTTNLYFYNAASILKLGLTGNVTVKELVVTANNSEPLSGYFLVSNESLEILDTNFEGLESGNYWKRIFKRVTMADGLQLSGDPQYVYVVVPPKTYEGGITVTVIDADGKAHTQKTNKNIVAKRSEITEMAAFDFGTGVALTVPEVTPAQTDVTFRINGPADAIVTSVVVAKTTWDSVSASFENETEIARYFLLNYAAQYRLDGGDISRGHSDCFNYNGAKLNLSASKEYKLVVSYLGSIGTPIISDFTTLAPAGEAPALTHSDPVVSGLEAYVDVFTSENAEYLQWTHGDAATIESLLQSGYTLSTMIDNWGGLVTEEELAKAKTQEGLRIGLVDLQPETAMAILVKVVNATGAESVIRVDFTTGKGPMTTIAALNEHIKSGATEYEMTLADAYVTYVNGRNVYLQDATGGILFFAPNTDHGYSAGCKLSGKASGTCEMYKGIPELKSMEGELLIETLNSTPCYQLTLDQLLDNFDALISCRVLLIDVTVTDGIGSSDAKGTIEQNGSQITLYSKNRSIAIESNSTGNVIVYPTYYDTELQVYIWEQDWFESTGTPTPDPDVPAQGDGSFESPYTVAQALEAANETVSGDVYVKGIVTRLVSINSTYHNIRYYISDDGTTADELYVYDGKYLDNENFESLDQLAPGDEVIIFGKLKIYNGTKELDRGNYIVEHIPGENNTWGGGESGGGGTDPGEPLQPIVGPSADWYEIPTTINGSSDWKYITHHTRTVVSNQKVRNYTSCYDVRRKNPMWVASAHHPCYLEGSGRTSPDPWMPDPCLNPEDQSIIYSLDWKNWPWTSTNSKPTDQNWYWSPSNYDPGQYFTKGHLLRSHDRRGNGKEINKQTFYPTNISPEIHLHPNIWTTVENALTDDWTCSDTTYVVTGNYYGNDQYQAIDASNSGNRSSISKTCIVPVARYRVILRTKSGNTGKPISQCSSNELIAIGFWFPQKLDGTAQTNANIEDFIFTVDQIEQKIGGNFNFFPKAPASVMSTVNPSDWGL